MMKFGIDTEVLHLWFQNKRIDVFGFIEKAAEFGYDGVVLNLVGPKKNQTEGLGALGRDDQEHLIKVRDFIREKNLYVELDTRGTGYEHLVHILDIAELLGAERVRTFIMGGTSYSASNLGGTFSVEDLKNGIEDLKKIVPELEKRRIFLAVENHELETAEEMRWIIEQVNSPWVRILFDPGNYLNAWEDPVHAAKMVAPYIIGTHIKDNFICMDGDEAVITSAITGEGTVDLRSILRILLKETTLQRMNIEASYLYTGVFSRPVGTGGSSTFEGSFQICPPPLPIEEVRPKDYYLYEGSRLTEMQDIQMAHMRDVLPFVKTLCHEIMALE